MISYVRSRLTEDWRNLWADTLLKFMLFTERSSTSEQDTTPNIIPRWSDSTVRLSTNGQMIVKCCHTKLLQKNRKINIMLDIRKTEILLLKCIYCVTCLNWSAEPVFSAEHRNKHSRIHSEGNDSMRSISIHVVPEWLLTNSSFNLRVSSSISVKCETAWKESNCLQHLQ